MIEISVNDTWRFLCSVINSTTEKYCSMALNGDTFGFQFAR